MTVGCSTLPLNVISRMFNRCIVPGSKKTPYNDGNKYVVVGKMKNKWRMTLRTKGGHGPTLEINKRFPTKMRKGEITKYRLGGKLNLNQFFRKVTCFLSAKIIFQGITLC